MILNYRADKKQDYLPSSMRRLAQAVCAQALTDAKSSKSKRKAERILYDTIYWAKLAKELSTFDTKQYITECWNDKANSLLEGWD